MTATPIGGVMFFLGVGAILVIASENGFLGDSIVTMLIIALLLVLFAFVGNTPITDFNTLVGRFTHA